MSGDRQQVSMALGGVLRIEHAAAQPPFDQVRRQLADAIGDGRLATGTRLPPIRTLAEELGLAANTVARAYRELESAGLVVTRGRSGTIVAAEGGASDATLSLAAADYVRAARAAGTSETEAVGLVRDAFRRLG